MMAIESRILLADDAPAIRRSFAIALSRAGFAVTVKADGYDAWKALDKWTFDLLITDNQIPRLAGEELGLLDVCNWENGLNGIS